MKVTPLGTSACMPNAGDASSGYLLETHDSRVLIDCGSGVLSNLRRHVEVSDLDAIVISHMHQDHFIDLIPLQCGLKYLGPIRGSAVGRIPVYLPPGGAGVLEGIFSHLQMGIADRGPGGAAQALRDVFDLQEFGSEVPFRIGAFDVLMIPVSHDVPSWAVAAQGDRRFAYSGDSGPCSGLDAVARDADLFMCEVGAPEAAGLDAELGGTRCHLSVDEAVDIAKRNGVRRLALTHMWQEYGRAGRLSRAQSLWGDDVVLATVNLGITI
jgi:ribonuclease BN (tRNA processing enzyme)